MTLQNKMVHTADVAKWKAEQQVRLLKSQGQVRQFENQIRAGKSVLADKALILHQQKQLTETDLIKICDSIVTLHKQITNQQRLQEKIKEELPPEAPQTYAEYSPSYPPFQSKTQASNIFSKPQSSNAKIIWGWVSLVIGFVLPTIDGEFLIIGWIIQLVALILGIILWRSGRKTEKNNGITITIIWIIIQAIGFLIGFGMAF